MNKSFIKIPKEAIKYIALQRTDYLKNNFFTRLEKYFPKFKKILLKIKCFLFQNKIRLSYKNDLFTEYEKIKQFLPTKIESILDIGCGIAGIDILISNHYNNNIKIFLLDKTEVEKNIHYNFIPIGSFYNSLEKAKKFLIMNRIDKNNIYLQQATKDNLIMFDEKFDLVISLLSWGFHYPIKTYLQQVKEKMNARGILIMDIRKNTEGEEEIKKMFGNIRIISTSEKIIKILTYKK